MGQARRWIALAAVASLMGCRVTHPTTPKPVASTSIADKASAAPVATVAATLTGSVTLIADAGGALISNNGGTIISDHASGIISDHASGVISNNAGSLVGKDYRLQAATLATFALADAVVSFTDAAGKPILDAQGQPITARTDAQGSYRLSATLPATNMLATVKLWNGGSLSAILIPTGSGAMTLNLDTASTLGATYVLQRFVRGDQGVLDRLQDQQARKLIQELDVVRSYLDAPPSYGQDQLLAATEALRTRVATVDKAIEDVKALLLGQAHLGTGLPATQVALAGVGAMVVERSGRLDLAEGILGRIRGLGADGLLQTVADVNSGTIKHNFLNMTGMALGPDGSLYTVSHFLGRFRAYPDGHVDAMTTTLAASTGRDLMPHKTAVGPDGTVYVGEFTFTAKSPGPRVIAFAPGSGDGRVLEVGSGWLGGTVNGVAVGADGSLTVLYETSKQDVQLYRYAAGKATLVAELKDGQGGADLALDASGAAYVTRPTGGTVLRITADGKSTVAAGKGGPAATADLGVPAAVAVAADGTLYVSDGASGLVHALAPDGGWKVVAGTESLTQTGDTTAFALNQPTNVAFDDQGGLFIVESGSGRVRRYQDGALTSVAGRAQGHGGDGGPAVDALLALPSAIALRDGEAWITEIDGPRIRHIDAHGLMGTWFEADTGQAPDVAPGASVPGDAGVTQARGLAVDARHRLYLTSGQDHRILRYTPGADGSTNGGTIEDIAGTARPDFPDVYLPTSYVGVDETDQKALLGVPGGVAIGPDGKPYFTEMMRCRVARIDGLDGAGPVKLTRVAGMDQERNIAALLSGDQSFPDDNGKAATDALLVLPTAVAFDRAGNMYVAEAGTTNLAAMTSVGNSQGGNSLGDELAALSVIHVAGRVRKIAPDGTITTIAGKGSRFFPDESGENALVLPWSLSVSPDGRLAIADLGANTVRILPAGSF